MQYVPDTEWREPEGSRGAYSTASIGGCSIAIG